MIQVGDILVSSWGYDQTNIDWYRVVDRKGDRVYLQKLASHETETGFMCGTTVPGEAAIGPVFYRKAKPGYVANTEFVKIKSFAWGSEWDGKPERCSWYA